jgi:hypothetical protein
MMEFTGVRRSVLSVIVRVIGIGIGIGVGID